MPPKKRVASKQEAVWLTGSAEEGVQSFLGRYRRNGEHCNARHVFTNGEGAFLYFAEDVWWVNDVVGELAGFIANTFSPAHSQADGHHVVIAAGAGILADKGVGCEQYSRLGLLDAPGDFPGLQGGGVEDHFHAGDNRQDGADGQAEAVKGR